MERGFHNSCSARSKPQFSHEIFESHVRPFLKQYGNRVGLKDVLFSPSVVNYINKKEYVLSRVQSEEWFMRDRDPYDISFPLNNSYGQVLVLKMNP